MTENTTTAASGAASRTPTDYALEFAEYLARGAEHLIEAVCADAKVRLRIAERDDVDDETEEDAQASVDEALRSLRDRIGEFRSRRDRAARAALAAPAAQEAEPAVPPGFALVPMRMNREMERVVADEDGWQWEDLLAAACAISESDYTAIMRDELTDDEIRESFTAQGVVMEDAHLEAVREILGNIPRPQADAGAVPEGCTPADARMLRKANHALAAESFELQTVLRGIVAQAGGALARFDIAPQADAGAAPEGCTPADAQILRKANHALAAESFELQAVLRGIVDQAGKALARFDIAPQAPAAPNMESAALVSARHLLAADPAAHAGTVIKMIDVMLGQAPAAPTAGLPTAQEPKYTVSGSHIVNRSSGEPVPHDEPVFVFRARDALGVRALEAYLSLIAEREPASQHADAVRGRIADFQRFVAEHPERMKWPDTATPAQDMESVLIDGVAYQTPAPVAAELLRLHLEAMEAPAAGAVPIGTITQPYTVAEIRERVASGDYSAELMLQHALLHLGAGAAPTDAGGVDWLGLALDLEKSSGKVESQTAQRAMLAAAHGLRLIGAAAPAPDAPRLLGVDMAAGPDATAYWTAEPAPFQQRVQPWLMECFGPMIAGDREERNHRFLEESLELVQACGCSVSEAHQLVDYVFGRPVGEPAQEVGGVMVTLAALCLANGLDMHAAGETELARIWTKVEAIRAKQAAKPKHSPLPEHTSSAAPAQEAAPLTHAELQEVRRAVDDIEDCGETDVDYDLLLRAAMAGYLECARFQVLDQSALDRDAARARQEGQA